MADSLPRKAPHSDFQTALFIVILCLICGFLLAVVAFALGNKQKEAKEFDQSKQMLIAAKILGHSDSFQIVDEKGELIPARFDRTQKILVKAEGIAPKATEEEIKEISALRIRPLLTNKEGTVKTFEEKQLTMSEYLAENQKTGYANLPNKLFYAILPNDSQVKEPVAYVFPVSGFGLWGPIYGYIAVDKDGDKVIGTTWYEHAETPGLGANIAEPWWQEQFYGKLIFQESAEGKSDFKTADMGIIVVKGKVADVYGSAPRAKSAVDGISGATLTGDGVTAAYKNSLTPYRPFLMNLSKEKKQSG